MNLELVWAAGLLEGEGSFYTKKDRYGVVISCQMTDLDVLERLQCVLGGSIVLGVTKSDKHKTVWSWSLHGKPAACMMVALRDQMGSRRKAKIDEVLEGYWDRIQALADRRDILRMTHDKWVSGEGSLRKLAAELKCSHETIRRAYTSFN